MVVMKKYIPLNTGISEVRVQCSAHYLERQLLGSKFNRNYADGRYSKYSTLSFCSVEVRFAAKSQKYRRI